MNRFTFVAAAAVVSALGVVGCDDKRPGQSTMPPGAGTPPSATRPSGPMTQESEGEGAIDDAVNSTKDTADKAGAGAKDAAGDLGDAAQDAGDAAGDAAQDAGDKAGDALKGAGDAAEGTADDASK